MARPKIILDMELITGLARIHCTQAEIAGILHVSKDTLTRNKEFCFIYKKAIEEGKISLRRLQWQKAQDGNTTMLIWLGKQYLNQTDKTDVTSGGKEVGREVLKVSDIKVQEALTVLRDAECIRPMGATDQPRD